VWGSDKCPVREVERAWIEEQLAFLHGQFGDGILRGPVLLPTDEYFPGSYTGSPADIRRVFGLLCRRYGVSPDVVRLEITDDDEDLAANVAHLLSSGRSAAGVYHSGEGVVAVQGSLGRTPVSWVATLAHELGHARLIGEGRVAAERRDGEPLTDLATVFFGCGIFTANAALEFSNDRVRWRSQRLGYLTEPMFGYALACYARLRGEPDAPWASFLDTNPRAYFRKGARYLHAR
jgi:hypothetical protein